MNIQNAIDNIQLKPCYRCDNAPVFDYAFDANYTAVPGKKQPHKFQVRCSQSVCSATTDLICAEEDEIDINEAIRMTALLWNSLPAKPDDSAITAMYDHRCNYDFKSQEEAKAYYEGRGESYDPNVIYLATGDFGCVSIVHYPENADETHE